MKRTWDKRNNLTTKIAYVAGFFDGEGCVRIKKSNKQGSSYYVTVHITNTDKKVLEFIQEGFGGKIYFQEKSKNMTVYQYYLACGEAVDFLKCVEGYLQTKKRQANLAIDFYKEYKSLTKEKKVWYAKLMSDMKIIYENQELLKESV